MLDPGAVDVYPFEVGGTLFDPRELDLPAKQRISRLQLSFQLVAAVADGDSKLVFEGGTTGKGFADPFWRALEDLIEAVVVFDMQMKPFVGACHEVGLQQRRSKQYAKSAFSG